MTGDRPDAPADGRLEIRRAAETDAARIAEIYAPHVLTSFASFETEPVGADEMAARIRERLARYDWLVAERARRVVGYACYGAFRTRAAYAGTAESTVYLAPEAMGRGWGRRLYGAAIDSAARRGIRELIGVIALPNPASLALHRALGFREVGVLRGVGRKFDRFVDVALWQRSLGP